MIPSTSSASNDPAAAPVGSHQALYRRWRAQTFAEIVGQEAVVETLRNAVRLGRVSHAILFVGPRGTGKTSLARILAKALNCTDLQDGDPCDRCEACTAIREGRAIDLVEIDAASNRGIDAIRDLRERIHYAPTDLARKVYILDEAHQITRDAWNALLKSLEEPPESVAFMFASTHPQEFPPAVLSRLQRFDVRRLTVAEIEGKLQRILAADGREAEPAAIRTIARLAAGGMRDAESMLDQLLASSGERLDESRVRDLLGLAEGEAVESFLEALVAGDAVRGIRQLDDLDERGRDARVFLDQVIEALRVALVAALESGGRQAADRLAAVARRLATIDPNRAGTGGLRLQLELALFAESAGQAPSAGASLAAVAAAPRTAPEPAPPTRAGQDPADGSAAQSPADSLAGRRRAAGEPSPATPAAALDPADAAAPEPADATAPDGTGAIEPPGPTPAAPGPPSPNEAPRQAPLSGAAEPPPDLERLLGRWTDIVASVRPATRAIISECRPLSVDGNVVTLGFPEAKAFLRDVAERKRPDLEAAVGGFLGREVAVRCVATNIDLPAGAQADADAALILAEARRIFADDLVDVGEIS